MLDVSEEGGRRRRKNCKEKASHNSLKNVERFRRRKALCERQPYAHSACKSNFYTSDKVPSKCFVNSMGNNLSSLFKSLT